MNSRTLDPYWSAASLVMRQEAAAAGLNLRTASLGDLRAIPSFSHKSAPELAAVHAVALNSLETPA